MNHKISWLCLLVISIGLFTPIAFAKRTITIKKEVVKQEIKTQYTKQGEIIIDVFWTKEKVKNLIKNSKYPKTLDKLVSCESNYVSIAKIDSNGYYSRGILQYQKSTWDMWSKQSGIKGNPMNAKDAITMAEYAIKMGYLGHWSCAKIQGLL